MEPYAKPRSYNEYSAGRKTYGGGSPVATMGKVDPLGYAERDRMIKSRRNAILRRLKAGQSGRLMSADWLGGTPNA